MRWLGWLSCRLNKNKQNLEVKGPKNKKNNVGLRMTMPQAAGKKRIQISHVKSKPSLHLTHKVACTVENS